MKTTEPMMVNCKCHGEQVSAVVCRHMLRSHPEPADFLENCDDPNDLQAWCHLCEEKFQQEDGMTDAFKEFNDMAIVCVTCYAEIKSRHTLQVS